MEQLCNLLTRDGDALRKQNPHVHIQRENLNWLHIKGYYLAKTDLVGEFAILRCITLVDFA